MFHRIVFLLLIVSILSCNFHRCAVCFQSFMNIACGSTQNAARIKRFWRLHMVIKPLNKKKKLTNSFWSVTLLIFIQTLHSSQPAGRIGDLGNMIYFSGFAKSPRAFRSSWILNECNFYFKIVRYYSLSEVCMIKTAPHSTVSPQMWCIKSIKGWFTHPQICWQEFVK